MSLKVGFVGTGANPTDTGPDGYGMAYRHADAYESMDGCELVCCADIVPENARAFADQYGIPNHRVFEDHETMLREAEPDLVSVCVPPKAHASIVIGAAETGIPRAIHCEKPMAATWGECREMAEMCEANDVRLTVNHQRRFGTPFRRAKRHLDDGEIGDLTRIEFAEGNLYDAGIHLFDLCGYMTDGGKAEWILAGLDYRRENVWFGAHNENQAIAHWRYADGTNALAGTGESEDLVGCYLRLQGTDGCIEIGVDDGPPLQLRRDGHGWETLDTGGADIHGPQTPGLVESAVGRATGGLVGRTQRVTKQTYVDDAIDDVVDSLRERRPTELHADNALRSTELVFGAWESVRKRGRVEFPLRIDDNPLEAMVAAGQLDLEEQG
jgi:predicted dehydrogenase